MLPVPDRPCKRAESAQTVRRNDPGVAPKCRLKARLNEDADAKPVRTAMSVISSRVSNVSRRAVRNLNPR